MVSIKTSVTQRFLTHLRDEISKLVRTEKDHNIELPFGVGVFYSAPRTSVCSFEAVIGLSMTRHHLQHLENSLNVTLRIERGTFPCHVPHTHVSEMELSVAIVVLHC
jgi:hypothetical protein